MPSIECQIQKLRHAIDGPEFLDVCQEVADELRSDSNSIIAAEPILRLLEEYRTIDFGTPGPLVHFVETFHKRGYEKKLLDSLKRQPTAHTLLTLNRLINGSGGEQRERYLEALNEASARADLTDEVRNAANEFRRLH